MSLDLYADLGWLPRAPADSEHRFRRLGEAFDTFGEELRSLAAHALDEDQLARIARALSRADTNERSLVPLTAYRLGLITNATPDLVRSAISGTGARFGFAIDCVTGAYDQGLQDSLDAHSTINVAKPNAVLIAIDWRGLPLRPKVGAREATNAAVQAVRSYLNTIRTGVRAHSGAVCIVQNVAAPPERVFGSLDRSARGTLADMIRAVNDAIGDDVANSADVLLDVASVAETVGLANWHSPTEWNVAKLPFASRYLPLYADHVVRLIAAMHGRSRRCLVLDLDNTLWGGVIGDDGLAGIQLAQGEATGEAFLELQRYVLSLRDRGVVLAVSSKNDDQVARSPFREHPEMLLREEHIAVFQANWNDKATNIAAIANELSLGLESLVFLDDNPFERQLVRQTLPQVAVVELPEDPAYYARTLSAAGYFELTRLSTEDLARARFYEGNARRANLQKTVGDLDAYLASLDMEVVFQPFDDVGRARITQLVNKSNQYNLTTRRYTEAEIEAVGRDPSCFALQVRLLDSFGDNGMISVVICRGVGTPEWTVDTWLMSCRVLGRRVEHMVLHELLGNAARLGASAIIGQYIPTSRNGLVEDHYAKLGFELVSRDDDAHTVWRHAVDAPVVAPPPIRVRRVGLQDPRPLAV